MIQLDAGSSKDVEHNIRIVTRNGVGNAWNTKAFISLRGGFVEKNFKVPLRIPEKTDIEIQCKSDRDSAISAGFELILLSK